MSISIAIIGASGLVGSTLVAQILRSHLLEAKDRIQLVGHGAAASEGRLLGTRIDLLDAFDDERVEIEVVPKIIDVDASIVVIASGVASLPRFSNRRDMGVMNRDIFERITEQCALKVPKALYIVISNPVELAIHILCQSLDRRRVLGMGSQQDSLRFARAIAKDLGISRRCVRACVLGEHGQSMVPIWSTVELLTSNPSLHDALYKLREQSMKVPLRKRVAELHAKVVQLLDDEKVAEAYEVVREALPDARIFVEPFITAHNIHSTPNATSNATLQFLTGVLAGDRRRLHAQVKLEGEVFGLNGICGVPITLSSDGWHAESLSNINSSEKEMMISSMKSIADFISTVMNRPPEEGRVLSEPVACDTDR